MDEVGLKIILNRTKEDRLIYDDALVIKKAVKELGLSNLQFCSQFDYPREKMHQMMDILRMTRVQYKALVDHGVPEQVILLYSKDCRGTSEYVMRQMLEKVGMMKLNKNEVLIDSFDTFQSGLDKISAYLRSKRYNLPSPESGTVMAVHNVKEAAVDLDSAYSHRGR